MKNDQKNRKSEIQYREGGRKIKVSKNTTIRSNGLYENPTEVHKK